MRILYIAHRVPYPPNKGDKIRAFWQLRQLSREHAVDLFCFCDDPEDEKHAHDLERYCDRLYVERKSLIWSRVRALYGLLRGQPFSVGFFYSRQLAQRISSALSSLCYDRIVVFSSSMAQYVEGVATIPKVLDLVDVDSDKWRQYADHSSWPLSWLWRRESQLLAMYEARLVKSFSVAVVCTDAEAQLLRKTAHEGEIEVLQNFVDVDRFDPGLGSIPDSIRGLQPYIIFSGSMDYRPNVDAVLFFYREVFPLIRREVPEVRLVIAGRNPDRSVAALSVNPAVNVTGSVADMRPYLWGAAAAVVPLRIARGVQNKILEALAAGIPVVSTTAAAMALSQEMRSLLAIADTPEDISAWVIQWLQKGAHLSSLQLRTNLKNYIDNLDLHSQLQRILLAGGPGSEKPENLRRIPAVTVGNTAEEVNR